MKNCVPDWTMEEVLRSFHDLFPLPNDKKSTQEDNELVELSWKNGHVVMQSQSNRRHQEHTQPFKRNDHKPNSPPIIACNLIQEDDWLHYAVDDSLEKEFDSDLLQDIPVIAINSSIKNEEDMSPPKSSQITSSLVNAEPVNSTVGSSACGSSQAQNQNEVSYVLSKEVKKNGILNLTHDETKASIFDTTLTFSSGQLSTSSLNRKRKERDGDDPGSHGEEAEYESTEAKKTTKQKSSSRKSRAAEVHNLSERRRRDRINEKMRALQELIPHCNKSDKASMLDEAIEYLKSLQLQLQLMWMGSGMAPMMFPNVQQYMSRVSMPSNQFPLIRSPLVNPSPNQMPMRSSPNLNPVNFPSQIQNAHMPESYARYFDHPHIQMPSQQNQTPVEVGSNSLPTAAIPFQNIQNGRWGLIKIGSVLCPFLDLFTVLTEVASSS